MGTTAPLEHLLNAPWPCDTCGQPGYRNVGTQGYCAGHLGELYKSFDPPHFSHIGIGLPGRTTNPEDLTCIRCEATWGGPVGQQCNYCINSAQDLLDQQARAVLKAPEVDPADATWEQRMTAWAKRLRNAVDVGTITEAAARAAIDRQEARRDKHAA